MKKIETICPRDCPDSCFMSVLVEDGRIISVMGNKENSVTQGFTCPRGVADPKRVFSEDRILHPRIRVDEKPHGGFKRVSWREALKLVADKLRDTISEHGMHSVLLLEYAGNTGLLVSQFPQRLWNALGATKTDHALCSSSGHAALALHYGLSYGIQPEELLEMKVITFWGFNARVSSPHQWALSLRTRREKGAIIVVVDPRRSETAEAADIWLNPRPGSDVALAYGIARYLIEHDFIDLGFIEQWTHGFETYREEIMRWTPQKVVRATSLEWDQIEELGEAYGRNRPGVFMIGIGLQKSLYGAEAVRAVSLIPALLGYHRGFYYTNSMGRFLDLEYLTGESLTEKKSRIVSQVALGRSLEVGEFKFVYIYGMNPVMTLPDQRAVRGGLTREDVFFVVHDTHLTETAEHSDVVLPAPTFLEKDDIVISDSHPYTRLARRAIEPLGQSKDEVWVMRKLAEILELEEQWLFEDPWEALGKALEGTFEDGTYQDLLKGSILKLRSRPRDEYQTPTGKIEFCSTNAESLGVSPLPEQHPLKADEGWYILLNSAIPKYTHTQFRDIYGPIPQHVWINPQDAEDLGLRDEETVKLYNDLGGIEVRAITTNRVSRGVLWSPRPLTGLKGEPQNALVPSLTQTIGGGPVFNSTKVKVLKLT